MSLSTLAAQRVVVAMLHPGTTPAGHHWTIEDEHGTVLMRTQRMHRGGRFARVASRAMTLTGLDAGNDVHVQLRGAGNVVAARFESRKSSPAEVGAMDAAGMPLARSSRDGDVLTILSPDSDAVIATVAAEGDGPWPVLDPLGDGLGELVASEAGPRTMHLGLRRMMRYGFLREGHSPEPLALLPLFAALTY